MDSACIRRIVARYPTASTWNRFHLAQRLQRCPYAELLPYLPLRGKLLDLGCGFAHFGWYLREVRPEIEYFACDIDARKIALAQAGLAAGAVNGFHLFAGDARAWKALPRDFDAVVALDVFYLLPLDLQDAMLSFAWGLLAPQRDGALLLKILPALRGWPRWRTFAQERIMVALGHTQSSGAVASSENPEWFASRARKLGAAARTVPLPTTPPSDLLILRPAE